MQMGRAPLPTAMPSVIPQTEGRCKVEWHESIELIGMSIDQNIGGVLVRGFDHPFWSAEAASTSSKYIFTSII